MAFSSLAELVSYFENQSGDPTALNYRYDATHTASGLYQITDTTWNNYGGYSSAYLAPSDVQTSKFADLVSSRGLSDWLPYNAKLNSYVTSNPDTLNLPTISGQDSSNSGSSSSIPSWMQNLSDYTESLYNTINPLAGVGSSVGKSIGQGKGVTGAISDAASAAATAPVKFFTTWLGNNASRFLYGIVGLVLLIMALFIYALRTRDQG